MVQKSVEQSCGDHGISKNIAPFGKAAIGCEDHCASLVACVDELEEQVASASDDREITDLVNDQETGPAEEADAFLKSSFAFGSGQGRNEIGQWEEVDAFAGFDGFDAARNCQMAFAGSRWPEEVNGLVAVNKAELCEGEDPISVERCWNVKSKPASTRRSG